MAKYKFQKRYCVIGGAGFLGSHLVDHLINEGHFVLVLDNLITGQKKFLNNSSRCQFIYCDITHSEEQLRKIFVEHQIEYVFNYAAEPYIPLSFQRPLHVFDINARGALMVMNAAQEAGVKRILQISSAEIYGDAPDHRINEEYPARPHSTYGAAKLAIDCLVQARFKEAGTPVIALRQFNCVGERESHPYVIPEIIQQIANWKKNQSAFNGGSSPRICDVSLGNNSFRDFQYAGDAVRMAVDLLHNGQSGEVYNMGSEEGIKIYDLAVLIGKLMDVEVRVQPDQKRVRPWEIWHLQSDNTKLYSVIKTRPTVSLKEALKKTIEYFYANGHKWDF
ncbi:MAG: GDP-mannose 4,6-dehydratase [Patescibacteria group bacterium]|nr:GDP-mannose 4,6-dehydratase [Patescibacteria group bacterium]